MVLRTVNIFFYLIENALRLRKHGTYSCLAHLSVTVLLPARERAPSS